MIIKAPYYCFVLFFFLFAQFVNAEEETDIIYMYKNDNGVPEFTDTVKPNRAPDAERKLKNMTPEQEAESKAKLDQIIEDDKALDARIAEQEKQDAEREAQRQSEKQEQPKQEENVTEDESDYYNRDVVNDRPHRPINRPIRPKPPITRPVHKR